MLAFDLLSELCDNSAISSNLINTVPDSWWSDPLGDGLKCDIIKVSYSSQE